MNVGPTSTRISVDNPKPTVLFGGYAIVAIMPILFPTF